MKYLITVFLILFATQLLRAQIREGLSETEQNLIGTWFSYYKSDVPPDIKIILYPDKTYKVNNIFKGIGYGVWGVEGDSLYIMSEPGDVHWYDILEDYTKLSSSYIVDDWGKSKTKTGIFHKEFKKDSDEY